MIYNIFPTPISIFSFDKAVENKQKYLNYLYTLKKKDPGENKSNVNSWHSSNSHSILTDDLFGELNEFICKSLQETINEMGYDKIRLFLRENWCIISPKGAYNNPHMHSQSFMSGSYYVSNPSSPIVFHDPRPVKDFMEPQGMSVSNIYNSTKAIFQPKEGDLLLFPSWLTHSVPENQTKQDRVIISFNFYLIP